MLIAFPRALAIVGIGFIRIGSEAGHCADTFAEGESGVDASAECEERGPHVQQTVHKGAIVEELITQRILKCIQFSNVLRRA